MSKENIDMSIEKEFNEAIEKLAPGESYSFDTYGFIFEAGYSIAQKEMQEKLDAAIEITKFLSERLIHVYNESENLDYHVKARDFLKAMGRMIKWYKPSEKMPEEGDEIVLFDQSKHIVLRGIATDCLFEGEWKMELSFLKFGDRRPSYIGINDFDFWAYASEFNFPKEEK